MTKHKRLEEILNIDSDYETDEDESFEDEYSEEDINNAKKYVETYQSEHYETDKINKALPVVEGLEEHDREMDDLSKKAIQSYEELMSLGMNVDAKFSGKILEVAANMLGHSITAKNSKVDKKLKMIDLQLKKKRLDLQEFNNKNNDDDSIEGDGEIIDRNAFLRELMKKNADN